MEARRQLDDFFMEKFKENEADHKELKEMLREIKDKLETLLIQAGETNVRLKAVEKEIYGNNNGLKKQVKKNTDFINEHKHSIQAIPKLQATILKWMGAIAVLASISSIVLGKIL